MIKIGTVLHLELFPEKSQDGEQMIKYKCKLVDIEKNHFIIDQPVNEETGKSGYFYEGTEFNLWFVGNDGAIYSFRSELVGRKTGNIPMYKITDPGKENYMRTQRRNYVRVEISTDVAIHSIDGSFQPFRTHTIDISGGGLLISLPRGTNLIQDEEIICYVALPMQSEQIHYIKTVCKVVRVFQKDEKSLFLASLQITDITERDRSKIIRFCFENELISKNK